MVLRFFVKKSPQTTPSFQFGKALASFAFMQGMRIVSALWLLVGLATLSGFHPAWQSNSFQAHMRVRTAQSGYMQTLEADIYYSLDGRMVTYYTQPKTYTTVNNRDGELQVYNPERHTVFQRTNPLLSSENSQLFFFLHNRQFDMGLSTMGFRNTNTNFEDNLMVSEWTPPIELTKAISGIKMVHDGPNPIYLEYKDPEGMVVKKVYFYNYQKVGAQQFPQAMTQIDYLQGQDSILSKTEFTQFKIDADVDQAKLNWTVPADAKLVSSQ